MAVILPVNTIGQTWFPYLVAHLQKSMEGGYNGALMVVLAVAMLGALAIMLLPGQKAAGERQ
jgi:hypothetical protein